MHWEQEIHQRECLMHLMMCRPALTPGRASAAWPVSLLLYVPGQTAREVFLTGLSSDLWSLGITHSLNVCQAFKEHKMLVIHTWQRLPHRVKPFTVAHNSKKRKCVTYTYVTGNKYSWLQIKVIF